MDGRTEAAIELRHRNISAVLAELDLPAVPGYKPLPRYQKALIAAIIKQLGEADFLDALALDAVQRPATPHAAETDWEEMEVPAPEIIKAESELFVLSRVFEFRKRPRLFHLRGPMVDRRNFDPISYRARFF